ncbi:hypothetical protein BDQ94DRAFT_2607 [Aspergillus welwitschiae]|uniref:Uncharacterized protein n=1 Tax=Aspergillus welwitschiae TaxID=1341132 RepID=A0A3F3QJ13_9EURO|nr:hypothetical protein BDQ94DRAFT_2607 [Aspergillus welwitschiae]RDH39171.1 hypothetical protein BDQ94DRAFT_2607 [Aspergillus welwitschiae]
MKTNTGESSNGQGSQHPSTFACGNTLAYVPVILPGSYSFLFFSSKLVPPLLTHACCDPSHLLLPICIVFNLFTLADEPLGRGSGRPESAITFPFLLLTAFIFTHIRIFDCTQDCRRMTGTIVGTHLPLW